MSTLDRVAKSHGTDKCSEIHDYCVKYEKYLPFKRYEELNILEIGVLDGKSLRTWKEYYYRSNILGIDINPNCKKFEETRINVEIGSQTDGIFLSNLIEVRSNCIKEYYTKGRLDRFVKSTYIWPEAKSDKKAIEL